MPTSATEIASWFIKNEFDSPRNTKDGNMKLQKLLYFAQLVHLTQNDEPLFNDKIFAFEHGSVVENVRIKYQWHFEDFIHTARECTLNFDEKQVDSVNKVKDIFGHLTASELSEINHLHKSWKDSYERSKANGKAWKERGEISLGQLRRNEVSHMKEILEAYSETSSLCEYIELRGKKFYFDPDEISINAEVVSILESFSGQDSMYTVYKDSSQGLVIY